MIRRLFAAQLLFLCVLFPAHCQGEQLVVNLSPSVNKRVFTFENPKGSIKVIGYEGGDIVVNAIPRFPEDVKVVNGMRRIEQNPLDISAETDGSNVTLYCKAIGKTVDFDIKIPRNFSLKLKSLDNGKIEVINVNGEIEVENPNGDISLENIAGSSVLSTVYGNISAVFREVKPDSPMMFTSFEGDISLDLPASVNATLKMKSGTGEIRTDFDFKPENRRPIVQNIENTRVYSLDNWIVGRINAGGPEYIIKSYSGNITIIKKQTIK